MAMPNRPEFEVRKNDDIWSADLFFDEQQRETIEAAMARIIPSDHEPGAREAGAVISSTAIFAEPATFTPSLTGAD